LGDGASWITDQAPLPFGTQAQYWVDFYHLGDYLAAAAEAITAHEKQAWREEKKTWLKENRWEDVLRNLAPALEPEQVPDAEAPIRAGHRYLAHRSDGLDYQGAIAQDPPMGSGEIESAHGYLFQKRLKIAGAWWKTENLAKMVALRIVRANRGWQDYWSEIGQKAA
jgi:hypothetical protein